jgi:hypothetical protein
MTSDKKVESNRRNALKSTGPKTPEGKDAVRLNALKHGLLSTETLLPGEDEEVLRELGERLRDELQPVGELENLLVDRIVASFWRLRRLGRVEAGIFAWELYGELARRADEEASGNTNPIRRIEIASAETSEILETRWIGGHKEDHESHHDAQEIEARQDMEAPTLGLAFLRDADGANAFSKLSRYETAIERSLYKALHELQRLQAARRADGDVPPPAAIDVDVSRVSGDEL